MVCQNMLIVFLWNVCRAVQAGTVPSLCATKNKQHSMDSGRGEGCTYTPKTNSRRANSVNSPPALTCTSRDRACRTRVAGFARRAHRTLPEERLPQRRGRRPSAERCFLRATGRPQHHKSVFEGNQATKTDKKGLDTFRDVFSSTADLVVLFIVREQQV